MGDRDSRSEVPAYLRQIAAAPYGHGPYGHIEGVKDLHLMCLAALYKGADVERLAIVDTRYRSIATAELPEFIDRWQSGHRRLYSPYVTRLGDGLGKAALVKKIAGWPRAVGLFLMNSSSGYVREAAIQAWGNTLKPEEMPFLIARLNDNVHQVRAAAEAHLTALVEKSDDETLLLLLPSLYRLKAGARHKAADMIESAFQRILASPDLIRAALMARPRDLARYVFERAWAAEGADFESLIRWGLEADSVWIRCTVLDRCAAQLQDGGPLGIDHAVFRELAAAAGKDKRHPMVRRAYIRLSALLGPTDHEAAVRSGLFDRSSGVRQLAQFEARTLWNADFVVGLYRQALESETPIANRVVALSGLFEMGVRLSPAELEPYFASDSARLQAAVFRFSCVPEDWAWSYIREPGTKSAKTARIAANYLIGLNAVPNPDVLVATFTPDGCNAKAVLALALALPYWDRLLTVLRLWPELKLDHKGMVGKVIWTWLYSFRGGLSPTPKQQAALKSAIQRLKHEGIEDLSFEKMEFALKGWK